MNNEPIQRSKQKIDRNNYLRLLKLHKNYTWLDSSQEALYELWNQSVNDNQKSLLEYLIQKFTFLNSTDLNTAGIEIANIIENKWKADYKNTYIVATCDNSRPDGSLAVLQSIKNKFTNNWRNHNFINSIAVAMNQAPDKSVLILIDDFIGTGKTMHRKINSVKQRLKKRGVKAELKIISLAAMDFSKDNLNKLNVDYESIYWLKKGISETLEDNELLTAITSMNRFESQLKQNVGKLNLREFTFGYKGSEALFALESYNIPNNVFPIFWWPKSKKGTLRNTLFKRL